MINTGERYFVGIPLKRAETYQLQLCIIIDTVDVKPDNVVRRRELQVRSDMRYFLVIVGLLALSTPSSAEDQAWFRLIGFSEDGSCAAWEMGGIQDGSGFQWVEMEIIDTETSLRLDGLEKVWNQYVDELPGEEEIASAENNILELCREYGIRQGNFEAPLVYHPVTDLSADGDSVAFCMEVYSPRGNSGEILLVLETEPAEIGENYPDWFPDPVMPLLMVVRDEHSSLFFMDRESHSLFYNFSIAAVYRNPVVENSLLMVLHAVSPGFEGPDGRFRVVSSSF